VFHEEYWKGGEETKKQNKKDTKWLL
jgi:hypothetical protein